MYSSACYFNFATSSSFCRHTTTAKRFAYTDFNLTNPYAHRAISRNKTLPCTVPQETLLNVAVQKCIWQLPRFRSQGCRFSLFSYPPGTRIENIILRPTPRPIAYPLFLHLCCTYLGLRCISVSPTLASLLCDAAQQKTQRTPQPAESVSDRPENFASGDSHCCRGVAHS